MNNLQTQNSTAFIEKVKKQAKRLLKFAKEHNSTIDVKNLAQAQELLAKVNGFPDWHALEKYIADGPRGPNPEVYGLPSFMESAVKMYNQDGVHYAKLGSTLVSFFDVGFIPDRPSDVYPWLAKIKYGLSFKWNMDFHNIKITVNYHFDRSANEQTFMDNSLLKDSNLELKKLFDLKLSSATRFVAKVIFTVTTSESLLDEHLSFCSDIAKWNTTFFPKESITEDELKNLNETELETLYEYEGQTKLSLDRLIQQYDHSRPNINWYYGLSMLYNKNTPLKIIADLSTSSQTVKIAYPNTGSSLNPVVVTGLFNSLSKMQYEDIAIDNPIRVSYIPNEKRLPWTSGIPFNNPVNHTSQYWNPTINSIQSTSNTILYGPPGSGKSVLLSVMLMNMLLQNANPTVSIIDIGRSSAGILNFLKHLPQGNYKNNIIEYSLDNNDTYIINPFDTELGLRKPGAYQHIYLVNLLSLLVLEDGESSLPDGFSSVINLLVTEIYERVLENPMPYEHGLNTAVDLAITKAHITITGETTWWDLVDAFFLKNDLDSATLAQRYATPTLKHAAVSLISQQFDKYKHIQTTHGEHVVEYLRKRLIAAINKYSFLTKPSNITINRNKVQLFDLDKIKIASKGKNQLLTIMYMICKYAANRNAGIFVMHETHNQNIPDIYKHYYACETERLEKIKSLTILDNFNDVSEYAQMSDILAVELRESRKYNASIAVATQSTRGLKTLSNYCSNKFSLRVENSEQLYEIRGCFNIQRPSEIPVIDKPSTLASIDTKFGSIHQYLDLNLTPFIYWLTTNEENEIFVRTQIEMKPNYLDLIVRLADRYPTGIPEGLSAEVVLAQLG